mmetsp:Transcript_76491/g.224500  ORF Transcript_76491/g.224500 Transcript_76491/m.224500 type:complete len:230 (+) Transcript_76491:174-863(+)
MGEHQGQGQGAGWAVPDRAERAGRGAAPARAWNRSVAEPRDDGGREEAGQLAAQGAWGLPDRRRLEGGHQEQAALEGRHRLQVRRQDQHQEVLRLRQDRVQAPRRRAAAGRSREGLRERPRRYPDRAGRRAAGRLRRAVRAPIQEALREEHVTRSARRLRGDLRRQPGLHQEERSGHRSDVALSGSGARQVALRRERHVLLLLRPQVRRRRRQPSGHPLAERDPEDCPV